MRLRFGKAALLLLVLGLASPLAAQTGVRIDSSVVEVRSAPEALLGTYRNDPAFTYDREPPPAVSVTEVVWRWIVRHLIDPYMQATTEGMRSTLLYGVLAAVLIFALIKLFGADRQGVFQRRDRGRLEDALAEEGIESIDLEVLAERAEREGRFREAIRLRYLQTLQRLAAGGQIHWAVDKTNRAYAAELRGSGLEQAFEAVTGRFERAWYGSLPVDAHAFAEARAQFDRFFDTEAKAASETPTRR